MNDSFVVTHGEKIVDYEGVVNITSLNSFFNKSGDFFATNLQLNTANEAFGPIDVEFHMGFLTEDDDVEYLTVFVNLRLENSRTVNVPVDLGVILYNREEHHFEQRKSSFFTYSDNNLNTGWLKFLETSSFLHDGKKITLSDDTIRVQIKVRLHLPTETTVLDPVAELTTDLEKLLDNSDNSDVTINVGEQKLHAHKIILTARSPVFAAMFQHDMLESSTNQIDIEDIDYDTMKRVLRFVYTGKIEYNDKYAKSLIGAAEKYNLQILKNTCIETLKTNLNANNCCEALVVGDIYCVSELRKAAMDFIMENGEKVAETSDFAEVLCGNPAIMKEVFLTLFQRKN